MQVNLQIAKVKEVTTSHSAVGTLHATTLLRHHVQWLLMSIDCNDCLATTSLAAGCLLCVVCFHHMKRVDLLQFTDTLVLHLTAILLGGCDREVRG